MILLDTIVISEAIKAEANPTGRIWLHLQAAEPLHISSVTLADLRFSIGVLPESRRNNALTETLDGLLSLFKDRGLALDASADRPFAGITAAARCRQGFPTLDSDAAAAHRFSGATLDAQSLTPPGSWPSPRGKTVDGSKTSRRCRKTGDTHRSSARLQRGVLRCVRSLCL